MKKTEAATRTNSTVRTSKKVTQSPQKPQASKPPAKKVATKPKTLGVNSSSRALLFADFNAHRKLTKSNVTHLQKILNSLEHNAFLNDDVCSAFTMEGIVCSKPHAKSTKAGLAIVPRLARFESAAVTLTGAKCVSIVYTVKLVKNTLLGRTSSDEFYGVKPGLKLVPRKENLQTLSDCLQDSMFHSMTGGGYTTLFDNFPVELLPTCNSLAPWTMQYVL